MTFRVEIEIHPHPDRVHCGECEACIDLVYLFPGEEYGPLEHQDGTWSRHPACLAAEKAWKERNP